MHIKNSLLNFLSQQSKFTNPHQNKTTTSNKSKFTNPKPKESKEPESIKTNEAAKMKSTLEFLHLMHWPKGSSRYLKVCVELTLQDYRMWRSKFLSFRERLESGDTELRRKERKKLLRFCNFLHNELPSDFYFLEKWWAQINHRVQDWEEWDGTFIGMEFSPRSKEFTAFGCGVADTFCNEVERWFLLLEEMNM